MAPISVTYEEAKETIGILPSLAPRPNASNLCALSRHLEQRLQTIPCHQAPEHGFLSMVMPPAIYALCSDTPWEEWPNPGPHPATAETTAKQNNLRNVYDANKAVFDSQQNVRRAVTEALNTAVPNAFRKPVGNQIGAKVYTIRDDPQTILADLRTKYGVCTPREKSDNNRRFDEQWNTTEPIEGLFDRLEDCYVFAIQNKPPFTLDQMIDKALIAIQLTGLYERALLEWQDFDEENKTWAQLKLHFKEAYEIRLASGQGTAGMHGYVHNLMVETDDDSITTIHESLNSIQLANNANYQALLDNLQAARAETASLRAELQTAKQSMAHFTQASQAMTTPAFVRPPTPHFQPAAPQMAPPVMTPPTYGSFGYSNHGYSCRTRSGHGRGRNNNTHGQYNIPPPTTIQAYGGGIPPSVGNIPSPIIPGVPDRDKPAFSNTTKYFNNWNMCYSCGWDVPHWHTSQTCNNRAPGHQDGCTRQNAQAYMTAGHRSTPTHITSIINPSNYYEVLRDLPYDIDDDDKTIVMSNLSTAEHSDGSTATTIPSTDEDISCEDTPNIIDQLGPAHPSTEFAILDSGATAHFIVQGTDVLNQKPATNPLRIKLPDGNFITSTHTCNLNIPWLPMSMTEAHIVPGLAHSSLVATKKFCDAGCRVSFDATACHIFLRGKLVLTGTRCPTTGLWIIPLNPSSPDSTIGTPQSLPPPTPQHMAYNVYTLPFKQQQLKYMHQAFFSPPVHTLIKAINNDQLLGEPLMQPDLIHKPTLTPRTLPTQSTTTTHIIPLEPIGDSSCNVFCYAALADKHTGTLYTDATGALPAVSLDGNQYYFVAYAYDPNYVFALPIHNLRDETILKAFDEVFQELKTRGLKPTFNVTDNQAAQSIKTYLTKEKTKWQFVEPNNHRVNAAERAIQTYKNHFISGLCTTDKDWPLQLWDTLTQQALITLNLLRTSRIDPTKSAYHQVHGHRYDWNAHPLSPPVQNSPKQRKQRFLKKVAIALEKLTTNQHQTTTTPTSEGEPSKTPSCVPTNDITFQRAVNLLTHNVYKDPQHTWVPNSFISSSPLEDTSPYDVDVEHFCAGVQHPVTKETITNYKTLIKLPGMHDIWTTAFGKEFGNLAQGDLKTGEKGTNTLFVMSHDEIANIPRGRTITYGRIVIDFRPQKTDPNRVRITAGGNLIKDYPGELTTRTADLTTSKILWNSVLSTKGAKFMGIDIKSFFLTAPLDRYEYMKMPLDLFPEHIIQQYDLRTKAKNGFVYLEIRRCMYGLPMAGALANKLLRERLAPHGYYEVTHTPGLWRHVWRPLAFTLVVDDFGVKFVGNKHAQHLIDTLRKHYLLAEDWAGDLYCGIKLDWNYDNRTLLISLPGYIKKVLQRFQHDTPTTPQHCPYQPHPKTFGTNSQDTLPPDDSKPLDADGVKRVQQVVGSLLFYARAVDNTILPALSTIASSQAAATELTLAQCTQLLDYCASNPDATIQYRASDMILNIHSDASYLSAPRTRSQVAGYYFLGSIPTDDAPIKLNGAILVFCGILKFVVASAAEAELGGLFLNCKEGKIQRLILEELGHHQPPTPIHCDNATATGIANDTIKKQRSRSMEMRFFWVTDQVQQRYFDYVPYTSAAC
eukprot:CCRYP_019320-RA/>CCRYP_019320-RA protein AED:0.37 eAED:0.35 QI:0/0/0/1/1/1/6/0/1607